MKARTSASLKMVHECGYNLMACNDCGYPLFAMRWCGCDDVDRPADMPRRLANIDRERKAWIDEYGSLDADE